jgi:hypothetical protein
MVIKRFLTSFGMTVCGHLRREKAAIRRVMILLCEIVADRRFFPFYPTLYLSFRTK